MGKGVGITIALDLKRLAQKAALRRKRFGREFEGARFPLVKILKDEFGLRVVQLCRSIVDLMGIACDEDGAFEAYEVTLARRIQARSASSSRASQGGPAGGGGDSGASRAASLSAPGSPSSSPLRGRMTVAAGVGATPRSPADRSAGGTPRSMMGNVTPISPTKSPGLGGLMGTVMKGKAVAKAGPRLRPIVDDALTRYRSITGHYVRREVGNSDRGASGSMLQSLTTWRNQRVNLPDGIEVAELSENEKKLHIFDYIVGDSPENLDQLFGRYDNPTVLLTRRAVSATSSGPGSPKLSEINTAIRTGQSSARSIGLPVPSAAGGAFSAAALPGSPPSRSGSRSESLGGAGAGGTVGFL